VPRAGLTPERIIAEAEDLADEVGLTRLTLAELANRLGVRLPSLYKHVSGMDGLQRAMSVRAKLELAEVLGRSAVGRSGDDAVRSMAAAYRAWATEHPGRYAGTVRAALPGDEAEESAGAAATGIVLDVIAGYHLAGADAVDAARAIRSALHGFITLEADHGFGLPVDIDRSFGRLVDALCRGLATWAQALEADRDPGEAPVLR
jgi:AcrR family transcriptional regulator